MKKPLINIITRCSRPSSIERCLSSVSSQTYKNVHHIVTYQNDEIKQLLNKFDWVYKVRVPNLKAIEGLAIQHYVHPGKDNFISPDWEWMERKVITDNLLDDPTYKNMSTKPESVLTVWDGPIFHNSLDYAYTVRLRHFPYNTFVKIAEQHVKPGWVVYLDDDDYLERETALEELVEEINKHDEDTFHLTQVLNAEGKNEISLHSHFNHILNQMKGGMPLMCFFIGGASQVFHTKYIEYTVWDEWTAGDWRTAKCLEAVIPKKNWVDNYFIRLGGASPGGDSKGL